jgi:hypothetical protein
MQHAVFLAFASLAYGLAACSPREEPAQPGAAPRSSSDEIPTRTVVLGAFDIKDVAMPQTKQTQEKKTKDDKKGKDKKTKNDEKIVPAGWFLDYDKALAQAKSSGKPLLVLFH